MSEYQFVAFRAVDGPVSAKNMEYMERQSSRAEITPWSFENEYHYGDFHGNAEEMLRRGYDLHLHYANFGTRRLMVRLPQGLPDATAIKPYLEKKSLCFRKDPKGPGGTLLVEPYLESGDLDDLWDLSDIVEQLVPLRAEILEGDLRPFYIAHLAICCDYEHDPGETKEAPVPAGMGKLTAAQQTLAEFYGLSESFLAAAAQGSPSQSAVADASAAQQEWLRQQPDAKKTAWLSKLLSEPGSSVRTEILADYRSTQATPSWPVVQMGRTISELNAIADEIALEAKNKAATAAARKQAKRIADMATDLQPYLKETDQLVATCTGNGYRNAATILAELRDALAGSANAELPEQQARKLKEQYPTKKLLASELRKQGFIPK